VDTVAQGFALTSHPDPEVRNLFTAPHPDTGEPINRFFVTPGMRRTWPIAPDDPALHRTDRRPALRERYRDRLPECRLRRGRDDGHKQYQENARNFLEYVRKNDLAMCGAVTCVKGDRSQEPSKQKHPDYYLHVVDKKKDGIVVKGLRFISPVHRWLTRSSWFHQANAGKRRRLCGELCHSGEHEGRVFICRGGRGPGPSTSFILIGPSGSSPKR